MKSLKLLLTTFLVLLFASTAVAQDDNVNLLAEYSLFHEYHKNKDWESALPHGWTVIHKGPEQFIKYRLFPKMEEILWAFHDSSATSEEEKAAIADTTLFLYDFAMEKDTEKASYYQVKKAYVLETWKDTDVEVVIDEYNKAFEMDPTISTFYKDRLGILYAQNAAPDNDYKLKALDLYTKLSEAEPENATWVSRIENLAENMDELVDITYKSWQLDKDNPEKAWKYASTAMKAQNYEKAIEPLKFLTEQSPEVVNYWNQLATAYQKLDRKDDAINAYKTLIELQPDNRDNYVNLALIYKSLGQLSASRSYLQKASNVSPEWDYPLYIEGTLYEQAARSCGFEFMDKVVYQLAVDTYRRARAKGGSFASASAERVSALSSSTPSSEDYFFRKIKSGQTIKIEGRCYDWINRSIQVP